MSFLAATRRHLPRRRACILARARPCRRAKCVDRMCVADHRRGSAHSPAPTNRNAEQRSMLQPARWCSPMGVPQSGHIASILLRLRQQRRGRLRDSTVQGAGRLPVRRRARRVSAVMVQFDPEHLRIAAKLREQERQRWRKHAVERVLAFMLI